MAASSPSTTASAISIDRNSARRSSSLASVCTVTPASCSAATNRGSARSAIDASTSSDSAALQTLGRRVLEFSRIRSATSRSADVMHVDMTIADTRLNGGHWGVAHHGVDQSRSAARDDHVDQAPGLDQMGDAGTVVAGQQLDGIVAAGPRRPAPPAVRRTNAAFDRAADELPRSSTALPDFRVSPKASTVTLGRPS